MFVDSTHVTCEAKAMMSALSELQKRSISLVQSNVPTHSLDKISNRVCCLVQHGFDITQFKEHHHLHCKQGIILGSYLVCVGRRIGCLCLYIVSDLTLTSSQL